MKKVLLINDHFHFGGGGDAVLKFEAEILRKNGYDVYTFSFNKDLLNATDKDYNYLESSSEKQKKIQKFFGGKKIDKKFIEVLQHIDPDVIHIHLISKYPISIYNNIKGYKVIQTLHGPNLFCASSWGGLKSGASCELGIGIKCYTRKCVSLSTALLYTQLQSRYWKKIKEDVSLFHSPSRQLYTHIKRLGLKNSKYIPLGIDKEFHQEVIKEVNDRPTLLFVGAIAEQKGIKVLIEALQIVKIKHPNVLLKIAGRGVLTNWIKEKIKEYQLENNINLLGFVNHENIRELYIQSDIFIVPSIWHEQFGLVGPEALACETPCIGSNIGGIPEWLHHNQWGLLVPPNEETDLADAIIDLINNPDKRKEFGKRGRQFVLEEYGADKYEKNILQLIECV